MLRLHKTFLSQPSWLRPTSARRLLVLRHGPSTRLQGVANVAGYEHPVLRSDYGRRDPRFDFGRRDPRFCWTPPRVSLDLVYPYRRVPFLHLKRHAICSDVPRLVVI